VNPFLSVKKFSYNTFFPSIRSPLFSINKEQNKYDPNVENGTDGGGLVDSSNRHQQLVVKYPIGGDGQEQR